MSTNQFFITIAGETARFAGPQDLLLTSGSSGCYEAVFTLDDSWQDLNLEAVFLSAPAGWPLCQDGTLIRRSVALTDGKAMVPPEVLSRGGYLLHAGISGTKGETERNSTLALVCRIALGAAPEGPGTEDIPETRYQHLLGEIQALRSAIGSGTGPAAESAEPGESDIPRVFFGGPLQQTKTEAVVPFRYISRTEDVSGYAEIKAQGNSSMSYPKKNQTVKMYRDTDCTTKMKVNFKGWGSQNKHCYKANWIDLSHARNVVSARIWADMVKARADYASLPELLRTSPNQGAVDGFPVKVYAGGVYQGRYTLNIPKDKWTFNMDDSLDTHCVLCGENYVSSCFRASASINGSDWTDEIHDAVPEAIKTRWNEIITFVMSSTDEEFRAGLSDYFYVDSLIDYHIFGLLSCGLDAYGKNQLYATYDGQKWIANMYDMDSTWGLYWNGSTFVSTDYGRTEYEDFVSSRSGNLLYIRLESLFYREIAARWKELKDSVLSVASLINHFERFTDIAWEDLVKEDYADTTADGAFTAIPSQSTNNIQQIRAFIVGRHAWTDHYISGLAPVPCTSLSLSPAYMEFHDYESQTIAASVEPVDTTDTLSWRSNDEQVCTVANGVVTPVASGETVVIASCGTVLAECPVYVSITDTPATYTITRNLTGCTSSGTSASVTGGGSISENIVASSGYTLTGAAVTITMGGTDIALTAYADGVVSIPSVTGDVVITIIAPEVPASKTVLYQLPGETIFDGTDDYLDTGFQLMAVDRDFSVCFDFTGDSSNANSATIAHCMTETNPWPGIHFGVHYQNGYYRVAVGDNQVKLTIPKADAARNQVVITHETGSLIYTIYTMYNGELTTAAIPADNSEWQCDNTLLLGAYVTTTGTYGRFWKGTIHDCTVYDCVLSQEKINEYTGTTG